MWKLLNGCLLTPENLQKLGFQLPSMCSFCKASSFTIKHTLVDCPEIGIVWRHFSMCFGFPHLHSSSVNQHFMNWWLRGNNTIHGFLRKHTPSITCWHIWKHLNAIIHGEISKLNTDGLINTISRYIYQWVAIKAPKKLRVKDVWLTNMHLLPIFKTEAKVHIVKWLAPPKGRLKLNVDASFTPNCQRGVGILRNEEGSFVCAASFRLSCNSSFQAEVLATIQAITWVFSFQKEIIFETDALEVIRRISKSTHLAASPFPIDILSRLISDNGVWISHVLREGNQPADLLAKEDRHKTDSFIIYPYLSSCPTRVRAELAQEIVPSFCFH
ncbi:hypothetical protein DM860_013274 [Cuscuta australis]|uniref:RNase H type-1 domain-containing protein n=1 Tax=Cuscuta australis TaxID=267555 RepID=A0A328DSF7_9ASTE|nr:hypothetical protein DM860_013274 [Cuscuta australis]